MSATRLLVLGAVRFMQPVHGYEVRRELLSWQLEPVTNVGPGSVYSALRTLEKDGSIKAVGTERAAGRPARTRYEVTAEGEKEFQALLRQAWWQVTPATEPLVPALTMMPGMPRDELVAAVQSRIAQLQRYVEQMQFVRATIRDGATGEGDEIPEHVREVLDFLLARTRGELAWARQFVTRLQRGDYVLQS
jgi:DNA-binding PadR family transcriptional regulator